ncbi:micrococcal nuclease [Methanococcoides vulcani]|uniref:Micrococcal nuclease n=1 Tax=Methanococcoides vulcani TaxID=1353158 RepID=A0A1H9ZT66_9EURY|nr:thermonuclease family protein [Methanococcoides vulcani]SES84868.1 micrococcal nuclease [Methanococcoides vulcani]
MGTRIENLQVTKVVDGDTIKVLIKGEEETLRLIDVDTEESYSGGSKPVTKAGKAATEMAKEYFTSPGGGFVQVSIEFDTDDPEHVCLAKHRGNYNRLLCYVHKGDENYNLKLVKEGWSPYFVKYGRSRLYHEEFMIAEAEAQANNLQIWNPETNCGGLSRDYTTLLPWWSLRASVIEDYREIGVDAGVLSVRLDYETIKKTAENEEFATVFCDLQSGINKWTGGGALIYAGSKHHKFNLWIPNVDGEEAAPLLQLIEKRYAKHGRGYVYVSGKVKKYKYKPQIVLTDLEQLSDFPPIS